MAKADILITPGDVSGIGPEVALKAAHELGGRYALAWVGPEWVWQQSAKLLGLEAPQHCIPVPALKGMEPVPIEFGYATPTWGRIAMECVRTAAERCMRGDAAAMVTAPFSKLAIHAAKYRYEGHTDFLAEVTCAPRHAMMLSTGTLRVMLATIHQSLRSVPETLSREMLLQKLELAHEACVRVGIPHPRIAVCALNPHAGESSAFGNEESHLIVPAIRAAGAQGIRASGPYPADSVFYYAHQGAYDIVLAMYHDQGLIAVKLLGFHSSVNTTVGLPIVRTSPGHGTAFDIAGQGIARPDAMIEAIKAAAKMAYWEFEE